MARILLDTAVLLWMLSDPERLPGSLRSQLELRSNALVVSDAALWEVAIKRRKGVVKVPDDLPRQLDRLGLDLLPIGRDDVWEAERLPPLHEDPIDRLMIAQALRGNMTFATHDRAIWRYGPACRLNVWRA